MIKESTVRPKPQNNNAKIVLFIMMLLSLISVFAYIYVPKYKGVVGLVVIGFVTTSIFFYVKYIAIEFLYDVFIDNDGVPLFVVRKRTGNRVVTLSRLEFANITDAKIESREERKKHKTTGGVSKYNYCPTLNPMTSCRVFYKSRYAKAEIVIEASEEYVKMLLSYAKEARELEISEDE